MMLPIPSRLQQSTYRTIARGLVSALLCDNSYFETEPWLIKAIINEYTHDDSVWSMTYEEARARLCCDLQRGIVPRNLVLQSIYYANTTANWGTVKGLRRRREPMRAY